MDAEFVGEFGMEAGAEEVALADNDGAAVEGAQDAAVATRLGDDRRADGVRSLHGRGDGVGVETPPTGAGAGRCVG